MLLFLAIVACCVAHVDSHARLICPNPQHPNSGYKSGVCGTDGYAGTEDNFMEVTPGPMTLRFEETIFHTDAPTSIRLLKRGDDNTFCTLLDHIPHNNAASVSFFNFFTTCKIYDYPIGRCKDSTSYITVIIPDIECDDCYLQLTSVMTDKYNDVEEPCVHESPSKNNCSTYFSCSNIKIRPTKYGKGRGLGSCKNDNSLSSFYNTWPYTANNGDYKYGVYRDLGADFTLNQWFPSQLLNNMADVTPSHPIGPCVSSERTRFAIFKDDTVGSSLHGILSFTTIGEATSISGLLISERGFDKTAGLDLSVGNNAGLLQRGDYRVSSNLVFVNVVNRRVRSVNDGGIVTLATAGLTVDSMNVKTGFQSKIFFTKLGGISLQPHYIGEAVFQPTSFGFEYSILVDSSAYTPNGTISNLSVNGPDGEVFNLTSSVIQRGDGSWMARGNVQFSSPEQVLMLQSGLLTIDVTTTDMMQDGDRQIRGVIPRFANCDEFQDSELCQTSTITGNGKPVDLGLAALTPVNGLVAFLAQDSGKLHLSGLLRDVQGSLAVNSVTVYKGNAVVATFDSNNLRTKMFTNQMEKTVFFEGEATVSSTFPLLSRQSSLDVKLVTSTQGELRGNFPATRGRGDSRPVVG